MASAGAHSDHVNHVSTQLPYALTAAGVSFVGYLLAGILGFRFQSMVALLSAPITLALMVVTMLVARNLTSKEEPVAAAAENSEPEQ
jgi:Na+/H+ antiporter NhaC